MRGFVYRFGRRRIGSVVLTMAAAGALAGGTAAAAAAKPVPHPPVKPPSAVAHADDVSAHALRARSLRRAACGSPSPTILATSWQGIGPRSSRLTGRPPSSTGSRDRYGRAPTPHRGSRNRGASRHAATGRSRWRGPTAGRTGRRARTPRAARPPTSLPLFSWRDFLRRFIF